MLIVMKSDATDSQIESVLRVIEQLGFKGHPIASVDDLHKQLVAAEIGVASPLMFLRGTEKLFCMVVPRELPPLAVRNRERVRQ